MKRTFPGILTYMYFIGPKKVVRFFDPLKANLAPEQASRASVKRKVPAERVRPVTKAAKKSVVADEQIETDGLDAFQSDDEVKLKKW